MIDEITVTRSRADVLPDSSSFTAFLDVDEWCQRQGWREFTDFTTMMRGFNDKLYMHYSFKDPNKAMMFKLAWANR